MGLVNCSKLQLKLKCFVYVLCATVVVALVFVAMVVVVVVAVVVFVVAVVVFVVVVWYMKLRQFLFYILPTFFFCCFFSF